MYDIQLPGANDTSWQRRTEIEIQVIETAENWMKAVEIASNPIPLY